MSPRPPRLAQKVFGWIAGSAHVEDLLGDLDEWFYLNLETKSPTKAKVLYWKQVISLSFSYAMKKRKRDSKHGTYSSSSSISFDMLQNYIKIAFRNLYQYKYFSVLNAFGLAIGMSISLLVIALYSFVRTYDKFHTNKENIYTIISYQRNGVEESGFATAPAALAEKIDREFAAANQVVRITKDNSTEVKTTKENIPMRTYFTEPNFFSVFTFELLQGRAASLKAPNQVILTESAAKKIFNEPQVVGKTIELANGKVLEVTGLMKDHPNNSHLTFEMLVSYSTLPQDSRGVTDQWTDFHHQYIYVLLNKESSPHALQNYLNAVSDNTNKQLTTKTTYETQHLEDIVMGPDLGMAIGTKWEASGFLFFGVFAALILLPACFNYTNISIARAMRRAKEIGLRKTMGGGRNQIFLQFITETVVITLISLIGSLLIFVLVRSEFQSMLVSGSALDLSLTWRMVAMFIGFALVTGIGAGLFPALYFAGLNPIQALKTKINGKGSSFRVRKGLSIFQFALSFGFILSLVMFSKQYRYTLNFDFGFEKENIVDIELQDVSQEQIRTAYSQLSSVQAISMSSGLAGVNEMRTYIYSAETDSTEIAQMFIDHNYIPNFGLRLIAGKNFPDERSLQERHMIVNEEFLQAHKIQTATDALGQTFMVDGLELEIIGVVKNFHYAPLTEPIRKFIFRSNPSKFAYANLKVAATDAYTMFSQMENVWKQLPTEKKFIGNYFEDELSDAYQTYQVLIKVVGFLGFLAITISLLGMLGMVVYTAETKTKEVGIRKVMGATIQSIALLLSKDYLKMMGWAMFISIPVTAFLLYKLLPGIQYYSVQLSVWDVLLSAAILLVLGLVTITSQTYKTAMINPATTLRSE
jgi:putative ABC transport system permease protein